MPDPEISIVVPTYNERENILLLIPQISEIFKDVPHEILVVDDNSPDGTGAAVKELENKGHSSKLVTKMKKEGIGAALRVGYDAARGKFIASTDADLSFEPADLRRLYDAALAGADLVTGNRHAFKDLYETPKFSIRVKHWVSLNGNRLLRLTTRIPLGDFSANFRMIRRSVWRAIETEETTNTVLFEMILKAKVKGFKITEIPVTFKDRRLGESKLRLRLEAPKFLIKLVGYLLRFGRELYFPDKRPASSRGTITK